MVYYLTVCSLTIATRSKTSWQTIISPLSLLREQRLPEIIQVLKNHDSIQNPLLPDSLTLTTQWTVRSKLIADFKASVDMSLQEKINQKIDTP